MKKVLGVYGNNQHTEYFLFGGNGEGIDCLKDGTASHEAIGFAGTRSCLHTRIRQLLERNRLQPEHIAYAAFGLAGADTIMQQKTLYDIIKETGLRECVVTNDAALGLSAGTTKGYGVCSVNSDGTVVFGVDSTGAMLQVGGLGRVTGDDAGLGFLGASAVKAVYDQHFRQGIQTMLSDEIMHLMGIATSDDLLDAISRHARRFSYVEYAQTLFACAAMDDEAARGILEQAADAMARSVAGCIDRLTFHKEVEVVLAGSVWQMPESELLLNMFQQQLKKRCQLKLRYAALEVPLSAGAVLSALGGPKAFPRGSAQRDLVIHETLRLLEGA